MSKIHEALRRLQKQGGLSKQRSKETQSQNQAPQAVVPIASNKKEDLAGPKYHLDETSLIEGGLLAPLDQAIPIADEFRRIKRPIIDSAQRSDLDSDDNMNVIMVASPLPGAGKTFCSMNLAVSISLERELTVLLVDADVAKPHISRALGLQDRPGLIDLLEDDSLSVVDVLVRTDMNNIQVLPAGQRRAQTTELLASERMAVLTQELATRYSDRIVIMDSPPLLITSEAQAVARGAGQIVVVVENGATTNQEIAEALELLDPDKAINLLLNKSTHRQRGGYYGAAYGKYGFSDEN